MSQFFSLDKADLVKGLVVAALVALLGALQQSLTGQGLDIMSYDWASILDVTWKATAAYLVKNVFTSANGKVFGKIG